MYNLAKERYAKYGIDTEAAIETLKGTVANGTTEQIKADTEALEKAFGKLSEKLYAQSGAAGGADAGAGAAGGDGTYYNADFEDNSNNQ